MVRVQAGEPFHPGANFRDPLVYRKRRARECSAFFRIPNDVKTFDVSVYRSGALWFETETRGAVPKCHIPER